MNMKTLDVLEENDTEESFASFHKAINSPYSLWAVSANDSEEEKILLENNTSIMEVLLNVSKELPPELSHMVAPFLLRYGTDIQKFAKMIPPELMDKVQYLPEVIKQYTPFIKEGLTFLMEQKSKSRAENKAMIMDAVREMIPEIALAVADTMEQYEIKTRLAQQDFGQ